MKKILKLLCLILIILLVYYNKENLSKIFLNFVKENKVISEINNNDYAKKHSYNYVKITDNFIVNNENEILNVLYTVLNSGMSDFTFYCDNDYSECMSDIDYIYFYIRMLFPSYYFDTYDLILNDKLKEEKILEITSLQDDYEYLLYEIYLVIKSHINIIGIEWINKKFAI